MYFEHEDHTLTFRFPAPAAFEVDEDAFDFPQRHHVETIVLDFENVKIISSLVISRIITLVENHQGNRVQFLNIGPELRNLLRRAGFSSWLSER